MRDILLGISTNFQSFSYLNTKTMKLLLGILIWLIAILLLSIPLTILILYKWLVILFSYVKRIRGVETIAGDAVHPLVAADSMLSLGTSWEKPIVSTGFILRFHQNDEGKRVSSRLRERFSKCFLKEQVEG